MKVFLIICLSLIASTAFSEESEGFQPYTLEGWPMAHRGEKCFLYVDQVNNTVVNGRLKFYAKVRTSYEPKRTILLVSGPRGSNTMVSVGRGGRVDGKLRVHLNRPPTPKSLMHAKDYVVIDDMQTIEETDAPEMDDDAFDIEKRPTGICVNLHRIRNAPRTN